MELDEGVNAEVEGRSKFGKSVVREIFLQRLGSRSVSGFGLPNKPQNLCKFVAILPDVTRPKARNAPQLGRASGRKVSLPQTLLTRENLINHIRN